MHRRRRRNRSLNPRAYKSLLDILIMKTRSKTRSISLQTLFIEHDKRDTERYEAQERYNQNTTRDIAELRRDLLDKQTGILPQIKEQTTKTNGRVTALEDDKLAQATWNGKLMGGVIVLTVIAVPILGWALITLVNLHS